jgi:acetyl-CoA carboxylase biotin carboxylase subunit
MFGTVLIANRGEIAVRIARTCHEMGIRVAAVYSTADEDGEILRHADVSVRIGPAAARRSYLHIPAIMEAAFRTGADAIHPGYGLLSEDPDLAEVCVRNGITFIGPSPRLLSVFGDKTESRRLLAEAGLPVLPGSSEPAASVAEACGTADAIGFPVIVKAAAGGGGRGMEVVTDRDALPAAVARVRATAETIFGDDRLYVERYLPAARHVEIQVLCDSHGGGVHLGERDCSVQRRHQKLVEETPAPGLPPELAARMGEASVAAAVATGYVGLGTFEFLVDPEQRFTFMEVNPRIQVEHPVTEAVYGVDLVAEQLRVAAGEPLGPGVGSGPRGVAIECRINAEDPDRGFVPTPGTLTEFVPPGGPFVRVDTHCRTGSVVPAAYDSLLAKVVVWAPDRPRALARMRRALAEFRVAGPGVHTTRDLLLEVFDDPAFCAGTHDTATLDGLLEDRSSASVRPLGPRLNGGLEMVVGS